MNEKVINLTLSVKRVTNWTVSNESGKLDIVWKKTKQGHHFWKSEKVASLAYSNEKVTTWQFQIKEVENLTVSNEKVARSIVLKKWESSELEGF